jgi:D-aminoacyl-tRNA deacylase
VCILTIKTKVAIIVPEKDQAAQTMWRVLNQQSLFKETEERFDDNPVYSLIEASNDIKLIHSKKDGVESNHLDKEIAAELYIFASRHRAASGTPALLIHPTGNWSKITLAGRESEISYTSSWALNFGLRKLKQKQAELNLDAFKVDMEVTHHGPTDLETPLIFMELGSSEEYWVHETGAKAVIEAIIETAQGFIKRGNFQNQSYIGIGGNHYAYRFHKYLMENEDVFVSHIAAKHSLDNLTENVLSQAFEKTIEFPIGALIDKKGARSEQRKNAVEMLDNLGKEHVFI